MRTTTLRLACALAALAVPAVAAAQDETAAEEARDEARSGRQQAEIRPYIEAAQLFTAELEPGNDTVTYTSVAAGVDASVAGRNSAASVSLRYERRFGYDDNSLDGDTVSGVARAGIALFLEGVVIRDARKDHAGGK